MLSHGTFVTECEASMLSPAGKCKTFDAEADGFARGEGCGSVVVKRLSQARADDDQILAMLASTAVNQDGRSAGLTAPNGPSQEAVIRAALQLARLQPSDIAYVESHGTATKLGDGIEWSALNNVFGGREDQNPLYVGSVKANVGHLEGASGIAGLIKLIIILRSRRIPPQANFKALNPLFDTGSGLEVPVRIQNLHDRSTAAPLACGISSFGFGGTNAHAILRLPTVEESGKVASTHHERVPWPFDRKYLSWRASDSPLVTSRATREGGREVLYTVVLGERLRRSLLEDHKVQGTIVVPAAVILEMLRAAIESQFQDDQELAASLVLREIVFAKPIVMLAEYSSVQYLQCSTTQITGRPEHMEWKIETETQGIVTVHAVASFTCTTGGGSEEQGESLDVEDAVMMHSTLIKPADFYQRLAARGLDYGPSFAALTRIAINRNKNSVFVKIGGPSLLQNANGKAEHVRSEYFVPPQLCDAAFQACSLLHRDGEDKTFMPFQMSQVRWHVTDRKDTAGKPKYAIARRLEESNGGLMAAAVEIYDQQGFPLLTVGRFVAKQLSGSPGRETAASERAVAVLGTQTKAPGASHTPTKATGGTEDRSILFREVLQPVVASRGGMGSKDSSTLDSFALIETETSKSSASELARQLSWLRIPHVDLEPSPSLHSRLSALPTITGVLFAPPRVADEPSIACLEVLNVVKALDKMASPPSLCIVDMVTSTVSPSQVPEDNWTLSGLVRACRIEYPHLKIVLWSLDESVLKDSGAVGYFMTTAANEAISRILPLEQEVVTDGQGHYGKIPAVHGFIEVGCFKTIHNG
jgi:hypothetical protein